MNTLHINETRQANAKELDADSLLLIVLRDKFPSTAQLWTDGVYKICKNSLNWSEDLAKAILKCSTQKGADTLQTAVDAMKSINSDGYTDTTIQRADEAFYSLVAASLELRSESRATA